MTTLARWGRGTANRSTASGSRVAASIRRTPSSFWRDVLGYVHPGPPGVDLPEDADPLAAWDDFLARVGVPQGSATRERRSRTRTGTAHGCSSSRCRRTIRRPAAQGRPWWSIRDMPGDLPGLSAGGGDRCVRGGRHTGVPVTTVRLLPRLEPPTVRDFVAFEEHVEGVAKSGSGPDGVVVVEWYATFYVTNPYAIVGAHDDVPVPTGCRVLDFELEVAAVVGARARTSTRRRRVTTSSATRSSTTGRRATCRAGRCG